jgi:hypothetical protein
MGKFNIEYSFRPKKVLETVLKPAREAFSSCAFSKAIRTIRQVSDLRKLSNPV